MQTLTNFSKVILLSLGVTASALFIWYGIPSFTSEANTLAISTDTLNINTMASITDVPIAKLQTFKPANHMMISIAEVPIAKFIHFQPVIKHPLEKTIDTTIVQKTIAPHTQVSKTVTISASSAASIWGAIGKQLQLDHKTNQMQVKKEIKSLLSDKKKFNHILQSSAPYIYYIYTQTKAKHLPAEIALIPIIESEFNPNDHSNKGAIGLWQLMPQTARELGIQVTGNYDGRRNVIDSTHAALAYFVDLGKFFKNNWYLAIAAYNCGQFKVRSATRHAGSTNFWQLSLPRETKLYVPKLLAVAEIIQHPQKYGITLPVINNKPFFTAINIKKTVSLNTYASKNHIKLAVLKSLNPDFRTGLAYAHKQLLVPATA